jgi:hypothetical protein
VGGRFALFQTLRLALADAATRAACTDSKPISPHRLRHTWATELLNCGIGLPALMKLMGHKSIQMTLRYLKVAQPDLQREFYRARQNSTQSYSLPSLSVSTATPDLPGIRQALAASGTVRHAAPTVPVRWDSAQQGEQLCANPPLDPRAECYCVRPFQLLHDKLAELAIPDHFMEHHRAQRFGPA